MLDVINNFTRLSEGDLYTQLGRIYKMAEENAAKAEPIGILTAAYRDQWSIARAKLMEGKCVPSKLHCRVFYFIVSED